MPITFHVAGFVRGSRIYTETDHQEGRKGGIADPAAHTR
jgi:hypothetical protein